MAGTDRALGGSPVLLADDDELARELVVRYLHKLNLRNRVLLATDGGAAMAELAATRPALSSGACSWSANRRPSARRRRPCAAPWRRPKPPTPQSRSSWPR